MARRLFGFSVLWCQAGEVPKTSEQPSLSLFVCVRLFSFTTLCSLRP
jgi:hypothetical protein